MKRICTWLILLLSIPYSLYAQSVENVVVTRQNKAIIVAYDLLGLAEGQTATVSLYCSEDGSNSWGSKLRFVMGDVGEGIKGGYGKQLVWQRLEESERLSGDCINFEVRAMRSSKSIISTDDFEMVFVQGGSFMMGCSSEQDHKCDDDETPVHQVRLSDYYIGKYELSQRQWSAVMGDSDSLSNPSEFSNCDNCPVEQVSWNDVQEFIKKLNQKTGKNYRLPTEAEWEYAARGGNQSKGYKYSGSNNSEDVGWYVNNSGRKTHPVGQKKANELGIYDMSGNVWEWCSDWYGSYSSVSQQNPQGPDSGTERVNRGGGCLSGERYARVSYRYTWDPDFKFNYLGFRLVLDGS